MKQSRKIWLPTLCGMLIAVSFCGTADVWAQLTGSGKLVPVVWNNGKIYFFQGSEYARYDIAQDMADSDDGSGNAYPRPIRNNWPGLLKRTWTRQSSGLLRLREGQKSRRSPTFSKAISS
ncbi:MAG: hemopexin repeat-containing protein [Nitrospirales bacterium]|nr:hemopexin repeat-containing protein [Nitrospirales bacterium]